MKKTLSEDQLATIIKLELGSGGDCALISLAFLMGCGYEGAEKQAVLFHGLPN